MEKVQEFFRQNKKATAAVVVAVLVGIIAIVSGSGKNNENSSEFVAEENIKSYEDEFDLSLGDLKLCMSTEQLQKIKGKEKSIENFHDSKYPFYMYDDLNVIVSENNLIFGVTSHTNTPNIKTEKGIHSGSTVEEIFAAYGKNCIFTESGDDEGGDLYQYIFKSKSGKNFAAMTFHVYGDTVKSIDWALIGEGTYKKLSEKVSPYENHVLARDFNLSIGNIKLGMTTDNVKNLSGNDSQEISESDGKTELKYPNMKITFKNGVVTGIVTHSENISTEENIQKGSNIDEIFAAYGDICAVSEYNGLTLMEYIFSSSNDFAAVMRFALNNSGIVDYISLRLIDENEKQNFVKAEKNFKQELLTKKQKAEEQARLEAEKQAEAQRQAELERQRQSQPREILVKVEQGKYVSSNSGNFKVRPRVTEWYYVNGSAQHTDYGFKAQFRSVDKTAPYEDSYSWYVFVQWNGIWYQGVEEAWNSFGTTSLNVNNPMNEAEDLFNAAYQDLNNR